MKAWLWRNKSSEDFNGKNFVGGVGLSEDKKIVVELLLENNFLKYAAPFSNRKNLLNKFLKKVILITKNIVIQWFF